MKSLFSFTWSCLCVFLCVRLEKRSAALRSSLSAQIPHLCVFFPSSAWWDFLWLCSRSALKTLFGFNSLSSPDSKVKGEIKGAFRLSFLSSRG